MTLGHALRETFNEAVNGVVATQALDFVPEQGIDLETLERTRELAEFVHHEGLKIDGLESSSVILSATAFAKLFEKLEKEEKKEKEQELNIALDYMSEPMRELYDSIKDDLKDYAASKDRENRLTKYLQNNDYAAMRRMYTDEYFMDKDEVANMNYDQLREHGLSRIGQELNKQEILIESIKATVAEYKEHADEEGKLDPHIKAKYMSDLDKLAEDYKDVLGTDFDKAFNQADIEDQENGKLYEIGRDEVVSDKDAIEKETEIKTTETGFVDSTTSGFDFSV